MYVLHHLILVLMKSNGHKNKSISSIEDMKRNKDTFFGNSRTNHLCFVLFPKFRLILFRVTILTRMRIKDIPRIKQIHDMMTHDN